MTGETLGAKFTIDITALKTGLTQANRLIKESNSEFKAYAASMDDWTKSESGLTAKLKNLNDVAELQAKKISALQEEYDRCAKNGVDPLSSTMIKMRTDLNNEQAAFENTKAEIAKYEDALKDVKNETEENISASDKLKQTIDNQEQELKDLAKRYSDVALEEGKNSDEAKKLEKEIKDLNGELKENKTKLNESEIELEETGDAAEKAEGSFTVFKGTLANLVSDVIQKAIEGFKELARDVVETGNSFEASMSKVKAISGATEEEFIELSDKAKELGKTTKFTATESSEAFKYMGMAGWKVNDMLEGIDGILALSAADGLELATTSDIVTDSLTAFGMKASDAGHFADVLAQAGRNANTNVAMLGESFKYAAPVAGALGYSVEDVSIALGLMANSGIKASRGGTALRTILTNLSKPTKDMAMAMDYLGISLQNEDGSMKSLMEVMQNLREAFATTKMPMGVFQNNLSIIQQELEDGTITEKKYNEKLEDLTDKAYGAEGALKAKYAATIAGKTGMAGLLSIVNTGVEDFDNLSNAIYNADGTAQDMADTMIDNLAGDLTIMDSELEGVKLTIYDKLEPAMREVIDYVNKNVIPAIDNFAENYAPKIADVFQWIIDHKDELVSGLEAIAAGFLAFKVVTIIQSVTTALQGMTIAQAALNVVMNANPIGLVVAAVAALAAGFIALWNNCDGFRNFFLDMGEKIKEAWQTAVQFIKDKIEEWKQKFDDLKTKISEIKDNVVQKFEDIKTGITEKIEDAKEAVVQKFEDIKTGMKEKVEDAKEAVKQKFEDIKTGIEEKIETIKKNVGDKFEEIKKGITEPIENAKAKVEEIVEKLKNMFDFEWKLPHIKLPHLSMTPGEAPYGIGGKGHLPTFDIQWLKNGGIVTQATNAIIGEDGPEAVIPLKNNTEFLDYLAEKLNEKQAQSVVINQTNNYSQAHSRYELYKSKQQTAAAVRLAMQGG